jgi:hypothetical protein
MLTVANAQTTMQTTTDQNTETSVKTRPASETKSDENKSELKEVIQLLREQQRELETLRQQISEQARTIEELRQRVEKGEQTTQTKTAGPTTASSSSPPNDDKAQQKDQDERLARVEAQAKKTTDAISKQLGSITFNGDLRLRYESFYGQLNSQTNASNPAILGNELSSRQRFRFRARFGMKGQIGDTVEWGLRFASGNLADPISTNQSFTDFFNRKAFELDQAYIAWTPKISEGSKVLRFQAGKFEMPWTKTELTFDSDLNVEGFSESYRLNFKNRPVENISFMAWQLPFLERNSGFVRNANGTVNVDETRRAGRDLALYGGQIQAGFKLGQDSSLTLSLADQYFSGTQFITPIQLFGSNLLIPVTITIPATSTSPAQTVTTQVSIPREFLVSGVNLGVSTASNNATNRDGRLSSGFNLVDVIARLNLWTKSKVPVMMILDYVRNTQTHPVLLAGPGGSNLSQPNNENSGYWAEIQLGKNKARGDWLLGYTLIRIEKDAVLTPFNYSDTVQQSDVRAHRVVFNYMVDPRVTFSFTGVFSQRPNGLSGVFGNTPARSLNRATTRLQFDTIFKF